MTLALVQVVEPVDNYDPATIALFALFIVALIVTAALLLRDLLYPPEQSSPVSSWTQHGHSGSDMPAPSAGDQLIPTSPPPVRPSRRAAVEQSPPIWFRQVMTTQQGDIAEGIRRTVHQLIDAGNRGDIRGGFAVHTPEYVARQQAALSLDPVALERMMRATPQPAAHAVAIANISDITADPPNRASALVTYAGDEDPSPPERFHFVYDQVTGVWLVDDIERPES